MLIGMGACVSTRSCSCNLTPCGRIRSVWKAAIRLQTRSAFREDLGWASTRDRGWHSSRSAPDLWSYPYFSECPQCTLLQVRAILCPAHPLPPLPLFSCTHLPIYWSPQRLPCWCLKSSELECCGKHGLTWTWSGPLP